MLQVDEHPTLGLYAFRCEFPKPLGQCAGPAVLDALRLASNEAPISRSEEVRKLTRDLLRQGGYKPTGRGKPSSEYLVRAAEENPLPTINVAVDTCNVVSLHSGLPISVVDLDRAKEPLRVELAAPETRYVFNMGGQEIDVSGLLCLHDADGACANAVKDAQRTKTNEETTHTLSLLWAHRELAEHAERTLAWYTELLEAGGARVHGISLESDV